MFCPECGKENKSGEAKCIYCGADLIANTPPETNSSPPKKSAMMVDFSGVKGKVKGIGKVPKIICLSVVCVVIVIGIAFGIMSSLASPQRTAEKYFEAVASCDWESVYDYLAVDESSPFLTKELFVQSMESREIESIKIENYEITDLSKLDSFDSDILSVSPLSVSYGGSSGGGDAWGITSNSSKNSELVKNYLVTYIQSGQTGEQTATITLLMQEERSLIFFHQYKVSPEQYIGSYSIRIPSGTSAQLNGMDLSAYVEDDSDSTYSSNYQNINIDQIFQGRYDLTVTSPLTEDYTTKLYISDDGSEGVSLTDLSIKNTLLESMQQTGNQLTTALYTNSTSGKKMDSFTALNFTDTESCKEIMDRIFSDQGFGEKNVKITSFKLSNTSLYLTDSLGMSCGVDFDYNYNGTRVAMNWSSEIEETPITNATGRITIHFTADENGNLKPSNISNFSDTIVYYHQ